MTDAAKAAETVLEEVTAGPWEVDPHGVNDSMGDVWFTTQYRICENATAEDARFIAAARDLVPALAADLAATRAALTEAQGEVERVRVEAWNAAIKVAMEEAEEHKPFAKGIECLPECIAALALKGPAHDR